MLPIEYTNTTVSKCACLHIIHTNSNNPLAHTAINVKIGIYLVLNPKEIDEKKFVDALSARELWATSVQSLGQIGAVQRQRQSC